MRITDSIIISEFSETLLLLKLKEENKYSHSSSFFLSLSEFLRKETSFIEVIPAEDSLAIKYNCLELEAFKAKDLVKNLLNDFYFKEKLSQNKLLQIPVCYSKKFGLDIEEIISSKDLNEDQLVELHCSEDYQVKMVGFSPGFAYLGDLSEKLQVSRLPNPRTNLLPGSVGIAGNRTGIYPFGGPGGWKIIGRTPLQLFQNNKKDPFLIKPGMRIKFLPINEQQFKKFMVQI